MLLYLRCVTLDFVLAFCMWMNTIIVNKMRVFSVEREKTSLEWNADIFPYSAQYRLTCRILFFFLIDSRSMVNDFPISEYVSLQPNPFSPINMQLIIYPSNYIEMKIYDEIIASQVNWLTLMWQHFAATKRHYRL